MLDTKKLTTLEIQVLRDSLGAIGWAALPPTSSKRKAAERMMAELHMVYMADEAEEVDAA